MLDAILDVFDSIGAWIISAVNNLTPMFWDSAANSGAGALTLMGVLAVVGLAFSTIFLILGIIQNFLHFRG